MDFTNRFPNELNNVCATPIPYRLLMEKNIYAFPYCSTFIHDYSPKDVGHEFQHVYKCHKVNVMLVVLCYKCFNDVWCPNSLTDVDAVKFGGKKTTESSENKKGDTVRNMTNW